MCVKVFYTIENQAYVLSPKLESILHVHDQES